MTIYIVWPDRRHVPDDKIEAWFYDAIADGDIEAGLYRSAVTVEEKARVLDDAGIITIGRIER